MAEKLKENDGAYWKGLSTLITFLVEKKYEERILPRSGGSKSELKLFDFIKNIRQAKTFKKIKKSKVRQVKIDGKSIVLDKESGLEILEEVLYKLVPKEKDPHIILSPK